MLCFFGNYLLWSGPPREILPGCTKTDTGPLASGTLVGICVTCLCSNQSVDKTANMLRFINTYLLYGQLAYTSNFGLDSRKT